MIEADAKTLCLALMLADSETEVIKLLSEAGYWQEPKAWRYYGDMENNFSAVGNQSSRPDAALVEKLINSIDARLTSECLAADIDPEGPLAPPTIQAAVAQFFGSSGDSKTRSAGKISDWSSSKRTEVARGITLAATGFGPREGTRKPCFTIADAGEGQTPRMMPNTLLSLIKSNKLRIPFVQGKYNMGSTGVLPFCGEKGLQLILTRRNPALIGSNSYDDDLSWSFTIVREEDPTGSVKHSSTTYLAPIGATSDPGKGGVLRFRGEEMPFFPDGRSPYGRMAEWGTLIKLYEYAATGYSNTNILMRDGLLSRLDILLPDVALPIRLHECRHAYTGHKGSFETTLTGLSVRLEDNKGDNMEKGFPSSCPLSAENEEMTATIFAFKKGRAETYRRNEGIIFTLNGQTHGHLTLDFFRRKNVGLSYLSDSVLVLVDCSKFSVRARERLFMASRDRLRGGAIREEIEQALEDMLKNHDGLRELKNRRRDEEIANRLEDSKPLEDILQTLLKTSPTLANFFLKGNRASNPFKTLKVKAQETEYHGKVFPTFFKFKGRDYGYKLEKECHINMRCRVTFETDVANDYFSRRVDAGEFKLFLLSENTRQPATGFVGPNLNNGIAALSIRLPENCKEGDILGFVAQVTDPSRVEPFENEFAVRVIEPHTPSGKGSTRRKPPTDEQGNEREAPAGIAMPRITEVPEANWGKYAPAFDKYTALRIKHAASEGEGNEQIDVYDFFINTDNVYFKSEIKSGGNNDSVTKGRFIYGMVLVGLALLQQKAAEANQCARRRETGEEGDQVDTRENGNGIEETVEKITRAMAPILLPMIESLGQLDAESVTSLSASGEAT